MNTMQTKIVDSTELRVGDIVHAHGGRFELVECLLGETEAAERAAYIRRHAGTRYSAEETEREAMREQTLRAFATKYLGPEDERWPCSVPEHWRDCETNPNGWRIQGNHNARWSVEVSE